MEQSARQIIFSGSVQGVGFRYTVFNIANRYCLTGMVRNLADGTVEMTAQGSQDDIDNCLRDINESFIGYLRQSQVQQVDFNPAFTSFKIAF